MFSLKQKTKPNWGFQYLKQHLAPSLAEIIRIAFGFGSTLIRVGAVRLHRHRGAAKRYRRNGFLRRRETAGGGCCRRGRGCSGISEPAERSHRLSSATQRGRRMANATRQRLLAVARRGRTYPHSSYTYPATAAEFI